MNTVWLLVTWDEGMPTVKSFEDEHEAIESLKESKPQFVAYLYQCNPDGMIVPVEGW